MPWLRRNTVQISAQTHDFVIPAQAGIQAVIPRAVAESMRRILIDRRMDCSDFASLRAE